MRLIYVCLCALLLALSPRMACAAPDAPPTDAAVYAEAVSNLRHGHDFARCIQQLQYLTARDSANRDYHLALGCADADRAVSLGYAALWTKQADDERAKALQELKDAQAHHPEITGEAYDEALASLPPLRTFVTKDDLHPFLMPIPQAAAQINALVKSAQDEWTRALALSPTPASRAEAEYVQGWGLSMLRLLAANDISDGKPGLKDQIAVPADTEDTRAFLAATKDAPANAVYWQSLGDAQYAATKNDEYSSRPAALLSYQKSLVLQPKNALLWYRVYRLTRSGSDNVGTATPQAAQSALQHVIDSDMDNAYPHYLLAGLLFKQTHYSDPHDQVEKADQNASLTADYDAAQQASANAALSQVEQGNSCARCAYPEYQPPYPALLSGFGVWQNLLRLRADNWGDYAKLRELARACGGYARIAAAHGDAVGLQRGARACIGMGMKIAGEWPVKDKEPGDGSIMAVLVGIAMAAIACNDLVRGEKQLGDVPGMQEAQSELDALIQRHKEYQAATKANEAAISIYDYY